MGVTVEVTMEYRQGCPTCAGAVGSMVMAAVKDQQVTAIKLRNKPKCEHDTVGSTFPVPKGQQDLPGMPRPTGYEQ